MIKTICLQGLRLPVSIGIHEVERQKPQEYVIDVVVGLVPTYRVTNDLLEQAVDYDILRERVIETLSSRHWNLQETVADQLIQIAFDLDDRVESVDIQVRKTRIYPDCDSVGLRYALSRQEWIQDLDRGDAPPKISHQA